METPNERLQKVRLELNFSQRAFGRMLGLLQGSYSDIERGKVGISPAVLKKLDSLGLNVDYILNGEGTIKKEDDSSIRERVIEAIDYLGYGHNVTGLVQRLGVRPELFNFYREKEKPSDEFVQVMLRTFPEINQEWLIKGTGAMLTMSIQEFALFKREIDMLRKTIEDKDSVILEKNKLIDSLYRQIDMLSSFLPATGKG